MNVPFIGVAAISFCLPGFWLCLGALCTALAHLHFVHLHSLWVVQVAFFTGLILCATGILGAFGGTRRCLWPISVFVGTAFAVLSLEAATGVVFLCQWNLVEETAKEHDQTGALLLVLRCMEAHPIIFSWLVASLFILQVATLFLAAHHAFDIAMDTEEPEEEYGLEAGEGQGEKAPLLLAYEQAYLPKPSKTPGQTPDKERQQPCARPAGAKQPPGSRCKVPEWRDVLLTAALIWLAATGLVLVIAMVKVGMYKDPGLGHHSSSAEDDPKHAIHQASPSGLLALKAAPSGMKELVLSALDTLQPDSKDRETKEDEKEERDHHSERHDREGDDSNDDDDDDDVSDDEKDSHHHSKAAEKHGHEENDKEQHRKKEDHNDSRHADSDEDGRDEDDEESEDEDRQQEVNRAKKEHGGDDEDEGDEEDRAGDAGELGKKPWKRHHHHHKKHKKHRKHCEEEEASCQEGAPRWFAGVLGVVGIPMLVLSSVAAAGVWCGFASVLHMFAGASAVFLASETLLLHMCSAHGPILVTAAEFDNSDGLQHTLDFVAEHSIATPLLVIVLLACQAGAMVAAANFGTPIPVKARVVTASAHLRQKVEEMNLPQRGAVLYRQARAQSIASAGSLRSAAGRVAERAGFPAAAARLAGSCPAGATSPGSSVHSYLPVAVAAEEGTGSDAGALINDDVSVGSDSKDPWASLRRALVPEGTQRQTVRWSDED